MTLAMPPTLPEVLSKLRDHEATLRDLGVLHAAVFGSVARGESGEESDIDILVDLDPAKPIGVFEYSRLKLNLAQLLGQKTDVANRKSLKPLLREPILRDAVNAF